MSQNWFRPHPYGVYPRGNAKSPAELLAPRFGTLSPLSCAAKGAADRGAGLSAEPSEDAFLDLMLHLVAFLPLPDVCRLSATCTGWYVVLHASDAFKHAHALLSPNYMRFRGSWRETAICAFLAETETPRGAAKRSRAERGDICEEEKVRSHQPIAVRRVFFCDQLFQSWMCTILPCYYHLRLSMKSAMGETGAAAWPNGEAQCSPIYTSALKEVPRCLHISPDEFRRRFEEPNLPVVLADEASKWPIFLLLQRRFKNFAAKKAKLFRHGVSGDVPMRCEHTAMSVEDYVRYASEQTDERPIYMFDAEFGTCMDIASLYTVPEHFARDDFFAVLGNARPKYRWIIAGPKRGGSSFHVDPNYTNAWNANLTGRKRWILFPPGCAPAGVFPSEDMSEVTTPVSLTEWLLNNYDASVQQWRNVGYECICEPGDIMFVPCGWWHYVINLEDSVAITQNYVSECNLPKVLKFLSVMKSSISGIDEDAEGAVDSLVSKRREGLYEEFAHSMRQAYPELMQRVDADLARDAEERRKKQTERAPLPLLDASSEGFTFDF